MKPDLFSTTLWLVTVAALWGGTNPLIKKGGKGIEKIQRSSVVLQFLAELWFLVCNWRYLLPFLLNQSGSVLFYLTLSSVDLSLAVPVTNSLTFIFTSLSGYVMGEKAESRETYLGMGLVTAGVALCVYAKS